MSNNPNFCPKCGSPLTFDGTFCPVCGSDVQTIMPQPQSTQRNTSETAFPQSPFQSTGASPTSFPQTGSSQTTSPQTRSSQTVSPQPKSQTHYSQVSAGSPVLMEFADLVTNARGVSDNEVEDEFTKTFNPGTAKMTYCIVLLIVSVIMLGMGFYWGGLGICMICYFFGQYNEERKTLMHNRPEAAVRGFYMRFLKKKYIISVYSETKILFVPSDGSKMYLPILFTLGNGRVEVRAMKQHIKQFDMIKKKF